MKVLKWIYANKISLTGALALILYILDKAFDLKELLELTNEAYYGLISFFFIIIGYAIKGRGFEAIQTFKESKLKKKLIKEGKTNAEIMNLLAAMYIAQSQVKEEEKTNE